MEIAIWNSTVITLFLLHCDIEYTYKSPYIRKPFVKRDFLMLQEFLSRPRDCQ